MAVTVRRRARPAPGEVRAAAPAARVAAGPVGAARQRNPGWLLAGVLLVLVSALAGVLLFSSADDKHEVLVAAGDVEIGQPLLRSHLRVVRMSTAPGVDTLGPDDVSDIVGRIAVGRIPSGTVLHPAMFDVTPPLAADEMVFGAALAPGAAPISSVSIGSPVRLLSVPHAVVGANPASTDVPQTAGTLGDGIVWGYEALGSGNVWVSVRTTTEIGLAASKAAQDDELRIVLVGVPAEGDTGVAATPAEGDAGG